MRLTFIAILTWLSLVNCRAATTGTPEQSSPPTNTAPPATLTLQPTETSFLPTLTAPSTQVADTTSTPTLTPPCVIIYYEENAQVELISSQGVRVLVDVYDPGLLSAATNEGDILLTTHTHWDHLNSDFLESFPGRQLMNEVGAIEADGVRIQGIPSVHNAGEVFRPEGGANYIYVMEINNLRIAHFGDIGQDALTLEQLDILGKVDVAITQLANPYSDMNAENQKGIKLMEQVGPKLIIPTHINLDAAKLAVAHWQGLYSDQPSVNLCLPDLTKQTSILLMGQSATRFGERLDLVKVNW